MAARARLVIALVCALPAVLCLDYILRFGVDCPFWDEFQFVPLIDKLANGTLTIADLFAPHNEHWIFFPRLVMLFLVSITGFRQVPEMVCSWALLGVTCATLFVDHVRRHGRSVRAYAAFVPVSFLVFTLRQEENLLWGWQIAITLFLAASVGAFERLCAGSVWPATVCAILASFSFAAGLAVWPIGAILLVVRRWVLRERVSLVSAATWCVVGAIVVIAYVEGSARPRYVPAAVYPLVHPWEGAYYMAVVLGTPLARATGAAAAAGWLLAGLWVAAAGLAASGIVDGRKALIALPLVLLAISSAVMLSVGRGTFGPEQANSSRYVSISMLGLIGLWRVALSVRGPRVRLAFGSLVAATVVAAVVASYYGAYAEGRLRRDERRELAALLVDYRARSDIELRRLFLIGRYVREQAEVLERRRLSVFATR